MSFTLVRKEDPNVVDATVNYKKIGEDLLTYYYNCYDGDLSMMRHMYLATAQFTFRDCEFFGFDNWLNLLKRNGIYKFTHHVIHSTIQPLNKSELLVLVHGTLSVNNSSGFDRFTETLIIRRDAHNKFYICNTIFSLVD